MGIGGTTSASCSDEGNMPPYYGTFQGVANFYPPQPSSSHNSYQGYTLLPVYAVLEGHPIRERRLPCCGLGLGWCMFILGFFLGGIPWYFGTFLLLCTRVDYREKPGLIACTIVGAKKTSEVDRLVSLLISQKYPQHFPFCSAIRYTFKDKTIHVSPSISLCF
ncbi:hypothetical protein AHAS_Ahas20G0015400 [Arachis hypogaea]